MTDDHEQAIIDKLRSLPPDLITEVEDLVDLLASRNEERRLLQAAAKLFEPSFAKLWGSAEDAAYDKL